MGSSHASPWDKPAMDWEIERRTHDVGVLRASREHGLAFGPANLKRLDDLDRSIAAAAADIAGLRRTLGQPPQAIASKLKFEYQQSLSSPAPATSSAAVVADASQITLTHTPGADHWPWWTLSSPQSPPRTDSPPQRLQYPSRDGRRPATAETSAPRGLRDRICRGPIARGAGRRRSDRVEPVEETTVDAAAAEELMPVAEITLLPQVSKQEATHVAPPLPGFLQNHPSRLAAALRSGFRTSAMRHANPGIAAGLGPPLVLEDDVGGAAFIGLQLGRPPTEQEWIAHNDRKSVSSALLEQLRSARGSRCAAALPTEALQ